jgi:hypothetical protein
MVIWFEVFRCPQRIEKIDPQGEKIQHRIRTARKIGEKCADGYVCRSKWVSRRVRVYPLNQGEYCRSGNCRVRREAKKDNRPGVSRAGGVDGMELQEARPCEV